MRDRAAVSAEAVANEAPTGEVKSLSKGLSDNYGMSMKERVEVSTGSLGMLGGAFAGAQAGGMLGSIVPGLGTLAGMGVGAVVGGWAGKGAGEDVGRLLNGWLGHR